MPAPAIILKRLLIVVHRWLGVALAAVFLLWFVSGIVMMYWTFPDVSARDRLERAPALRADSIALTPEAAYAVLGREEPPGEVRLTTFDGRPVYSFASGGFRGGTSMVYADTGVEQLVVDEPMVERAAAAWSGRPVSEARRELVEVVDQWTVGDARSRLPLLKYSWPDGQQLYIDEYTAEVVQYTTTSSRFWAYLGAIPHWFYFTPLRKHGPEWFSTVVWSSLIGTVAALMGVVIAIWMYSPRKRYRHAGAPTAIPYRGWKRWHTILGLLFGVVTTTWTFSGLLSMGPFPITDRLVELTVPSETPAQGEPPAPGRRRGGRRAGIEGALRGGESLALASYAARTPADAVASLGSFEVREIEFTTFAGAPVYLARNGAGQTRLVPMSGAPQERFPVEEVMRVVREAAGDRLAELRVMEEYDAYYLDRHGERPLPVVYARMNDTVSSRYYIDPGTARVVGEYNARNWVSRWLYRGLHSLDFPWLYKYRPLWDIVVISLMLGGTLLCMTSIVLAWRVLVRKLAVLVRARMAPVREDLAAES